MVVIVVMLVVMEGGEVLVNGVGDDSFWVTSASVSLSTPLFFGINTKKQNKIQFEDDH